MEKCLKIARIVGRSIVSCCGLARTMPYRHILTTYTRLSSEKMVRLSGKYGGRNFRALRNVWRWMVRLVKFLLRRHLLLFSNKRTPAIILQGQQNWIKYTAKSAKVIVVFLCLSIAYVRWNMLAGKASGLDEISVEHIIYAHPSLILILTKLFQMILHIFMFLTVSDLIILFQYPK